MVWSRLNRIETDLRDHRNEARATADKIDKRFEKVELKGNEIEHQIDRVRVEDAAARQKMHEANQNKLDKIMWFVITTLCALVGWLIANSGVIGAVERAVK